MWINYFAIKVSELNGTPYGVDDAVVALQFARVCNQILKQPGDARLQADKMRTVVQFKAMPVSNPVVKPNESFHGALPVPMRSGQNIRACGVL